MRKIVLFADCGGSGNETTLEISQGVYIDGRGWFHAPTFRDALDLISGKKESVEEPQDIEDEVKEAI